MRRRVSRCRVRRPKTVHIKRDIRRTARGRVTVRRYRRARPC